MRGLAGGGGIEGRVLVDDILAKADMDRDGDAEAVSRGENARLAVRKVFFLDHASGGLAQADAIARGLRRGGVEAAGFVPETELAGADVARDALASLSDQGELEIVDHAGAVERDVGEQAALHQVDQQRGVALAQDVRAAGEEDRGSAFAGGADIGGDLRQGGIRERDARAGGVDHD